MTEKDTPTTSVDLSHHLQRSILLQLRQNGAQTYQQLKPDGVEGNAYNYHLRNLKQAKLISSEDKSYELTPTGQLVADSFSFDTERLVLRPHMYTYVVVTAGDKVLLYHPTRQPLPGIQCLPSGKMHYGDDYATSIARELTRRNLTDDYTTEHITAINLRFLKGDEVIRQRPGTLWHIDYKGPLNESETPSGSSAWWPIKDIETIPKISPEVMAVLARIKDSPGEPVELTFDL